MGRKKLSLLGIIVKKDPYQTGGGNPYNIFSFELALGSPANPMFFTSPTLREVLVSLPLKPGVQLGFIDFTYSGRKNVYELRTFPFYHLDKLDNGKYEGLLAGKGISKGLERICNREFAKAVGGKVIIVPSDYATPRRVEVLMKRGLSGAKSHYAIPMNELQRGINRSTREFREANRAKEPIDRLVFAMSQEKKLRPKRPVGRKPQTFHRL